MVFFLLYRPALWVSNFLWIKRFQLLCLHWVRGNQDYVIILKKSNYLYFYQYLSDYSMPANRRTTFKPITINPNVEHHSFFYRTPMRPIFFSVMMWLTSIKIRKILQIFAFQLLSTGQYLLNFYLLQFSSKGVNKKLLE